MSDLLSSASLLLAILAVLYGLWYKDIAEAIAMKLSPHAEDRKPELRTIRLVLFHKALPLTIVSLLLTLTFIPVASNIVWLSLKNLYQNGLNAFGDYSAVDTSFVLVVVLIIYLTIYMFSRTLQLKARI